MPVEKQLRVNIIGAGLSGGALANALLNDPEQRFKVQLYERDDLAFSSERGGYQIRLGQDGIQGLKQCLDQEAYEEMRVVWGNEISRAPAIVNPLDKHVAGCLNDLKVYPKSRAIPRSALKDVLLQRPSKEGVLRLSKRLMNVKTERNTYTGATEVTCIFEDGEESVCDLLVAADGSRSLVNRLMGINNSVKVSSFGVQGRGPISDETYKALPSLLTEHGSLLMFGGNVSGFTAVYKSSDPSADGNPKNESFLFWAVSVPEATAKNVAELDDDEEKHKVVMQFLANSTAAPDLLPAIVQQGVSNIKNVSSYSSENPGDWRAGRTELGRVILIGDSIHPMTAGRGQGANQALRDAGVLQQLLKKRIGSSDGLVTDPEFLSIATEYDAEMYKRAFAWVKSSEQATQVNLADWRHRLGLRALFAVLTTVGLGLSILEALHLRTPVEVKF